MKTSGRQGLHVVLPIKPTPWDRPRISLMRVAAAMERDAPTAMFRAPTKSKRNNRIFVDYLRNSREATRWRLLHPGAARRASVDVDRLVRAWQP